MSIEKLILEALRAGPMMCHEVGKTIGLDPFRSRAWLETMREDGLVTRELDGRYGLASGGYNPGPGGGEAA